MANLYSQELLASSVAAGQRPFTAAYGGRSRRYRAVLNLASTTSTPQSAGSNSVGDPYPVRPTVNVNVGDNVLLANIPQGAIFDYARIVTTISLGSSVIAIGTSPVHASNGQYVAAQTLTITNTPQLLAVPSALAADPITTPMGQAVYLTVGGAALPTTGTLEIDLYFTAP